MMEEIMEDSRLVQIFLSQNSSPGLGVFEVSLSKDKTFSCNCPGYLGRGTCIHTRFVIARVKGNDGVYPLKISTRCTEEDAERAKESAESFREFIINFGEIEVC